MGIDEGLRDLSKKVRATAHPLTRVSGYFSLDAPLSRSRIFKDGSSASAAARGHPPAPPPTMM